MYRLGLSQMPQRRYLFLPLLQCLQLQSRTLLQTIWHFLPYWKHSPNVNCRPSLTCWLYYTAHKLKMLFFFLMVGGNSQKNKKMTFCGMQILWNSNIFSEYSHLFIYVLLVAASCYKGKWCSCDRLDCIACKVKMFAVRPLVDWCPKQATNCAIPDGTTRRGHLGPRSGTSTAPRFLLS